VFLSSSFTCERLNLEPSQSLCKSSKRHHLARRRPLMSSGCTFLFTTQAGDLEADDIAKKRRGQESVRLGRTSERVAGGRR
jgi:hypothetical protein